MPTIFEIMNAAADAFARGALERAGALCRRVTEAVPGQPDALFLQAVIARRERDDTGADGLVRRSAGGRPSLARLDFDAGLVLDALTRIRDPLPLYREVLRLQPGDAAGHRRLAQALLEGGEPEAVIELCRAARRSGPEGEEDRRMLADAERMLAERETGARA